MLLIIINKEVFMTQLELLVLLANVLRQIIRKLRMKVKVCGLDMNLSH